MPSLPSTQPVSLSSRLPIVPAFIQWGDPVTDPPSALGSLTFDVVLQEEHDRAAVVTDHAVESGINIVDNVRPLPDRITLDVFVSNSPLNSPDAQRLPMPIDIPQSGQGGFLAGGTGALISGAVAALSGPEGNPADPTNSLQRFFGFTGSLPTTLSPLVDQFIGDTDYVRTAMDTLKTLRDSATLLSVICPNVTYSNMILESIKLHRDKSTGTSSNATLEFREVRIVSSQIVDAPLPSIPRAAPSASTGSQSTTPTTGPKQSVLASAAVSSGLALPPPAAGFPAP